MFDIETINRFWSKVDIKDSNDCWEWQAYKDRGYGKFTLGRNKCSHRLNNRIIRSHVFAFEVANNRPINAGMCVCHSCDNKACCNPNHLWEGTVDDNIRDKINKGRQKNGTLLGSLNRNSRLTENDVKIIKSRIKDGEFHKTIAKSFGVHRETVSSIARGETWKHIDR